MTGPASARIEMAYKKKTFFQLTTMCLGINKMDSFLLTNNHKIIN
jgi:hypothetical protein